MLSVSGASGAFTGHFLNTLSVLDSLGGTVETILKKRNHFKEKKRKREVSCAMSLVLVLLVNWARVREARWTGDIVYVGPGIGNHSF